MVPCPLKFIALGGQQCQRQNVMGQMNAEGILQQEAQYDRNNLRKHRMREYSSAKHISMPNPMPITQFDKAN